MATNGPRDKRFVETQRTDGVVRHESEPEQAGEAHGMALSSSFVIRRDEETAALHHEATTLKKAGDWDGAVLALQKAQQRMRESTMHHTIESWLRLPVFLQQAGRFEESMREFERLIEEADERNARYFGQPAARTRNKRHDLKVIKEKMTLARKREEARTRKAASRKTNPS